jgi:hypothetical protein
MSRFTPSVSFATLKLINKPTGHSVRTRCFQQSRPERPVDFDRAANDLTGQGVEWSFSKHAATVRKFATVPLSEGLRKLCGPPCNFCDRRS